MLEKSRVVFQNEGEQNFHIFYYLLAGLESKQREYFLVNEVSGEEIKFNYLNNYVTPFESKQSLLEKYDELINAMNYVAFMENVIEKYNDFQKGINLFIAKHLCNYLRSKLSFFRHFWEYFTLVISSLGRMTKVMLLLSALKTPN